MIGIAMTVRFRAVEPPGRRRVPRRRCRWRRATLVCMSARTIAWGRVQSACPGPFRRDGSVHAAVTSAAPDDAPGRPTAGLPGLLDELRWRGLFHDATPGLARRLETGRQIAAYNGFDPSGPSLHVGHLVPITTLVHLQQRGGRPIVLIG